MATSLSAVAAQAVAASAAFFAADTAAPSVAVSIAVASFVADTTAPSWGTSNATASFAAAGALAMNAAALSLVADATTTFGTASWLYSDMTVRTTDLLFKSAC